MRSRKKLAPLPLLLLPAACACALFASCLLPPHPHPRSRRTCRRALAMVRAGRAIASLVLVQLFSKAINFALNVLVIRATGTRLFGVSSVPLALLLSTIQFLSREGVRGTCQRIDVLREGLAPNAAATAAEVARVVNLSWATLPLALCLAPLCAAVALWRGYAGVDAGSYAALVTLFGGAAVAELCAEPVYNLLVACDKLHVRALVDALAVAAKAATTWLALVVTAPASRPLPRPATPCAPVRAVLVRIGASGCACRASQHAERRLAPAGL